MLDGKSTGIQEVRKHHTNIIQREEPKIIFIGGSWK
jgi:hypothetical protein